MRRQAVTKLQIFDARHPGLLEKVHAMFAEFWPVKDVKHMLQAQYGARLSMSSLERYRSKHWRAQREMAQEISDVIGSSVHRAIWPSEEQRRSQALGR